MNPIKMSKLVKKTMSNPIKLMRLRLNPKKPKLLRNPKSILTPREFPKMIRTLDGSPLPINIQTSGKIWHTFQRSSKERSLKSSVLGRSMPRSSKLLLLLKLHQHHQLSMWSNTSQMMKTELLFLSIYVRWDRWPALIELYR